MINQKLKKILCFIPARGGSKRIPRKNIIKLANKPLVSYTIDAAKKAGVFDKIVVSSDDYKILDIAKKSGVDTDMRPKKLSGDLVESCDVVYEYLSRNVVKDTFNIIVQLLPTCPFRIHTDIQKAIEHFTKYYNKFDFLVGVTPYEFPPQLAMYFNEKKKSLNMVEKMSYKKTRISQSIPKLYHPNGSVYIAKINKYLKTKTFFSEPMTAYKMPAIRSYDIDEPYQFAIAQYIMKNKLHDELRN